LELRSPSFLGRYSTTWVVLSDWLIFYIIYLFIDSLYLVWQQMDVTIPSFTSLIVTRVLGQRPNTLGLGHSFQ
jgi:hypothetical protein